MCFLMLKMQITFHGNTLFCINYMNVQTEFSTSHCKLRSIMLYTNTLTYLNVNLWIAFF